MTTNEIWHADVLDVMEKLPDNIRCIVADPPYGVNFESRRAITPQGKKFVAAVTGDADLESALRLFTIVWEGLTARALPEAEAYVFSRWDVVGKWIDLIDNLQPATGFKYKMMLVWDKGIPGQGDIDANWGCGHELILYCKRGRRDLPYRRSGIIHVDKLANMKHIHPTEKPFGLIERLVEMSTDPGDWVVDPFSGSGSTSVACQALGRNSIGVEIDERYIQPSRARLAQTTMEF